VCSSDLPGKANAWIKHSADLAFTTHDIGDPTWQRVAPIVRASAIAPPGSPNPSAARERLGLDANTKTLFITGGSLGARTINEFVLALLESQREAFNGWQIIHQHGDTDLPIADRYERADIRAVCAPFFDAMGDCWGAADLAFARAGAGTVSEAWANRTPCLFMPYPFHKDEHQRKNAEPLINAGAARIAIDRITPDANLGSAGPILTALLTSTVELANLQTGAESLPPADGARFIASAIVKTLFPSE